MNDGPVRQSTRRERVRLWLFRTIFAAEYQRLARADHHLCLCADIAHGYRDEWPMHKSERCAAVDAVAKLRGKLQRLEDRLMPRPARIKLQGGLQREQILAMLAGTNGLPQVKAIEGLLMLKVVELSDRATDAPHAGCLTAEGPVAAFTNDERLHLAGGAATAAELLADLQELAAAEEQKPEAAP